MKKFLYVLQFVFAITIFIMPTVVSAQTHKVTPRIIDREVKQRDIFTETVTITNNRNHNVNIYATVNEVAVDEGGDITNFTPPSMSDNKQTVTSWIAVKRGRITLSAGETKEVPLNFKIHPDAEAGVYHAAVGFGSGNNREQSESQVKNGTAPTVIVTLKVDQERNEFLKLSKFIIDRFVTSADNTAIRYTLNNPGTADVVPKGEIIFYDGKGIEVASVPVNPHEDILVPGQETTYNTAAPIEGMIGKYKAFLSVDYGTAQLASVYDTAFFYVLPWQKLVIIFVVLLVIAVAGTIIISNRFAHSSGYDDDHHELPFYISESTSEEKDHDINLKQ